MHKKGFHQMGPMGSNHHASSVTLPFGTPNLVKVLEIRLGVDAPRLDALLHVAEDLGVRPGLDKRHAERLLRGQRHPLAF